MNEQQADNADSTTAPQVDKAEATTANDDKDIVNDATEDFLSPLEQDFDQYQGENLDLLKEGDQEPEEDSEEKSEPKAEEDPKVIETRATQKRFDVFAQENRELRAEISQLKTKVPIDTSGLVEPKPDNYDEGTDDPGYIAANASYLSSVATLDLINQSQQVESKRLATLDFQTRANTYSRRVAEVRKDIKDFDTIMAGSMLDAVDGNGNITPAADILLELENGPRVAAHIAKNPDLALILNRSTAAQVSTTICKLSAQLLAIPHTISDAPPPVQSEDKGGGPGVPDDGLKHIKKAKFY